MLYHLSVFLENNPGKLEKITKILAENKINLSAMSLASTGDFGVMKLLVDNPDKAYDVLKQNKLTITKRQIVAVVVDNVSGSFNVLLNKLTSQNVNIEDCYGFLLGDGKTAAIVLETETENIEKILKEMNFEILTADKIYK
jgi:hypothetical protein